MTLHSTDKPRHAADELAAIDARATIFGDDERLFGNSAWTMMLEMYVARQQNKRLSITDVARSSRAPASTGLRHIAFLEERGFVHREPDPTDRRRHFLHLADRAATLIEQWLSRI